MAHAIIGTAGHIDHGKTLLVKALTGTDTDRAPEEKARGITIELGFAFLGDEATVIDVPGHERFVKTMVAGVSTVDVALLVVAADDGVMPQSREHLDVLQILGVPRGVIALNKVDLAEEDWLELVEEDIAGLVEGTFLESAPVMRVSAQTGEGVDDLRQTLLSLARAGGGQRRSGPFRLPVDRAFVAKGFGLVCTGTVLAGGLGKDGSVEVLPGGRAQRVRGLQRQGADTDRVGAGDRAAVNLPGVEKGQIERGDVLAAPDSFEPTSMLDVRLRLLPSAPRALEQRTRVRLHLGTAEVMARVFLLEGQRLEAGGSALAQLRLESPSTAVWGDRFVIRRYSPALTIGGGTVLDPHPAKHRPSTAAAAAANLQAHEAPSPEGAVEPRLRAAPHGETLQRLGGALGLTREQVLRRLEELGDRVRRLPLEEGEAALHAERWETAAAAVEATLGAYHAENPHVQGLRRGELRDRAARHAPDALFAHVLDGLVESGRVALKEAHVHLAGHRIRLDERQEAWRQQVEKALKGPAFDAKPDTGALVSQLGVAPGDLQPVLDAMRGLGQVAVLEGGLLVHADDLRETEEKLRRALADGGGITVAAFRDLIAGSRKYALALLNHFDSAGIALGRGDERVLV